MTWDTKHVKFYNVYGHFTKISPHFLSSWATSTPYNLFSPIVTNFLKYKPDRSSQGLHWELSVDIAHRCARILWRNYDKNKPKWSISDRKLWFFRIFKSDFRSPKQALQPPIKSFWPKDLFLKTLFSACLSLAMTCLKSILSVW